MIRKASLALAASLLAITGAASSDTLRLKPEITVSEDTIRLDQLIEGAGRNGDIPVFRAPMPGTRGTIRADRILDAARELGIDNVETGSIGTVTVHRPGRTISRTDMQDAVLRELTDRGVMGTLDVILDDHVGTRTVDAARRDALKIASLNRDPRSGRFEARLMLHGSGDAADTWSVTGSIVEAREIAVPSGDLERGETIEARHLKTVKRPASMVSAEAITRPADLIGLVSRKTLRAGQPIVNADVVKPVLVEKNQVVTVIYQGRGIALTMRGKALSSGTRGETVRVQNTQSKRTVEGQVSGSGEVTISAPPVPVVNNASLR